MPTASRIRPSMSWAAPTCPESAKEKILWHGTAKLYGLDLPAMNKVG